MLSPTRALVWEIWLRKRGMIVLLLGVLLTGWLFNHLFVRSLIASGDGLALVHVLNTMFVLSALLVALAVVSYTEFNPQQDAVGFPQRLFVLPVRSVVLVALPLFVGIVTVVFVALILTGFEVGSDSMDPAWTALMLGVYMVFHQTILWTLSRLRALRMIVIGVVALIFMIVAAIPSFPEHASSKGTVGISVAGAGILSFLAAWAFVAYQRSGGGSRRNFTESAADQITNTVPRRQRAFASPAAAQFSFEWRRNGTLLPICVGGLLLFVITPLSLALQDHPDAILRIWICVVAMPMVLALPIGKAFSKPDVWSSDLALPSFTAVRPMTTANLVTTKMKVAALSTLVAWGLVIAFVTLWLPLMANTAEVNRIFSLVARQYSEVPFGNYPVLILAMLAGLLLTWRFLVAGLWIGLSGNRILFGASAIPYGFAPILVGMGIFLVFGKHDPIFNWARELLSGPEVLVWIAALAVLAKLSLSFVAWRRVGTAVRWLFVFWLVGTVCLLGFAALLWIGSRAPLTGDSSSWRILLFLAALLFIPIARPGFAPYFLHKNRHR